MFEILKFRPSRPPSTIQAKHHNKRSDVHTNLRIDITPNPNIIQKPFNRRPQLLTGHRALEKGSYSSEATKLQSLKMRSACKSTSEVGTSVATPVGSNDKGHINSSVQASADMRYEASKAIKRVLGLDIAPSKVKLRSFPTKMNDLYIWKINPDSNLGLEASDKEMLKLTIQSNNRMPSNWHESHKRAITDLIKNGKILPHLLNRPENDVDAGQQKLQDSEEDDDETGDDEALLDDDEYLDNREVSLIETRSSKKRPRLHFEGNSIKSSQLSGSLLRSRFSLNPPRSVRAPDDSALGTSEPAIMIQDEDEIEDANGAQSYRHEVLKQIADSQKEATTYLKQNYTSLKQSFTLLDAKREKELHRLLDDQKELTLQIETLNKKVDSLKVTGRGYLDRIIELDSETNLYKQQINAQTELIQALERKIEELQQSSATMEDN